MAGSCFLALSQRGSRESRAHPAKPIGRGSWQHRRLLYLLPILLFVSQFSSRAACAQEGSVDEPRDRWSIRFEEAKNQVKVLIGDQHFTTVVMNEFPKPILDPVYAPGQLAVTRHYPMRRVAGEADDHPHHKSIWFAHGDVNGVDFWAEKGRIKTLEWTWNTEERNVRLHNQWLDEDRVICEDRTEYCFGGDRHSRWIDVEVNWLATESDLELGDTKEGTFAIRTHPGLQLTPDPRRGVHEVFGQACNSEGDRGPQVWGKRAAWVQYTGQIEGQQVALMMMDAPSNPRHPTTWHARDYGLIAANPFGLSDFLKQPKGSGQMTIEHGGSLRLRYRILLIAPVDEAFDPVDAYRQYRESEANGE